MQLDWGRLKVSAGAGLAVARKVIGTAALAGLAVLLAAQAASARRERETVARECATIDRDIDRLKRANQALRDEIRALEADPVYVEALLRRWKRVGPSERVVE
jgi:septal ring factor EnvC (AmiA/AmiB activator)